MRKNPLASEVNYIFQSSPIVIGNTLKHGLFLKMIDEPGGAECGGGGYGLEIGGDSLNKGNYSAPCETVLFTVHTIQAYLHVFEPPSRPGKILLSRVGYADILPGRQERQGKIFCFAGMPQSKNEAFHLAVIKTPRTSRIKRKASSLTKTG